MAGEMEGWCMSRQAGVVMGVPWGQSWSDGERRGGLPCTEVGCHAQRWAGGALAIFYTAMEVGAYVGA